MDMNEKFNVKNTLKKVLKKSLMNNKKYFCKQNPNSLIHQF